MLQEEQNNPEAEQGVDVEEGESADDTTSDEDATVTDDKGDPLDQISDPEELRKEAKKFRGIASRTKPKPTVTDKETAGEGFLSKKEFYLGNERKAIKELRTDEIFSKNEDAIKELYVPRHGKATPEDVKEDLKDALLLWKARNPEVPNTGVEDLTTTVVTQPSGKTDATTKEAVETDPRFAKPKQPSEWYQGKK